MPEKRFAGGGFNLVIWSYYNIQCYLNKSYILLYNTCQ